MGRGSHDEATAANPVLAGFGLILVVWIWLSIPKGPIVRRDLALKVDPNLAPPQVLEALPGLGPVKVRAMIEARDQAPFRSVEDLDRRVKGIGPVIARGLKPFLSFDATEPRGP